MKKFVLSPQYEDRLRAIEDFIFRSTDDIRLVERFLDEHDEALKFIEDNPNAAAIYPETGDRSWPFGSGRYRIFFLVTPTQILLTDLIDNRQMNPGVYPGNSLPTFEIDD